MLRLLTPMFLALLLGATVLYGSGCAKKSTTVNSSAGNVTVEQNTGGETTTVKSEQGEVKYGKGAVDPASLGLPIYPGAKASDQNSVSVSGTMQGGEGGQVVMLTTDDSFDKVYDYYKSQMPAGSEKMKVASGKTRLASFQVGESGSKESKTVMIQDTSDQSGGQEAGGKVTIQLIRSTQN
jgi:hypothetical protein